jgi:hypothetical protein
LSLPTAVLADLDAHLKQPESSNSYEAIQTWLKQTYNIDICYSTLHRIVYTRLKVRPKIMKNH